MSNMELHDYYRPYDSPYVQPIVRKEDNLPYPWVYYSRLSAFIVFSKTRDGPRYMCECYRGTLEKFAALKKIAMRQGYTGDLSWIVPEYAGFVKGICHKCNQAAPTAELNYSGYSTFMTHYGWYVRKKFIDLGFMNNSAVLDIFPRELWKMVLEIEHYSSIWTQEMQKQDSGRPYDLERALAANKVSSKVARRFHNIVENMVREEFSYKRIGEHWPTETTLFNLVKQKFPESKVVFHYRPKFLEGLEIDIFIPDKKLGIEYQGIQHFKAIEFWGGEDALMKRQEHDRKKKALCDSRGIDLVYYYYSDEICEETVHRRLLQYLTK